MNRDSAKTKDFDADVPEPEVKSVKSGSKVHPKKSKSMDLKDYTTKSYTFTPFREDKKKLHLKISRKAGAVTEDATVKLPASYFFVREQDGKFGKNRQCTMIWTPVNDRTTEIEAMTQHYKTLFEAAANFIVSNNCDDMIPKHIEVTVDNVVIKYHDMFKKIEGMEDEMKTLGKRDARREELSDKIDEIQAAMKEKILSMFTISNIFTAKEDSPNRSKYLQLTGYPTKRKDDISEEVYQHRLIHGNIRRSFFLGESLRKAIRPDFRPTADAEYAMKSAASFLYKPDGKTPPKGKAKLTRSKEGTSYFIYDEDMVPLVSGDNKYTYRCAIDICEVRIYLGDSGEELRLKEEFVSGMLLNIVKVPEDMMTFNTDARETAEYNDAVYFAAEASATGEYIPEDGMRPDIPDTESNYETASNAPSEAASTTVSEYEDF